MSIKNDPIGDRFKNYYENAYRFQLTRKTPVIIRFDGRHFHSYKSLMEFPFDTCFSILMDKTARELSTRIQGAKIVYSQSDEISLLLTDFDKIETDAWFGYNIQKMVSCGASLCTSIFAKSLFEMYNSPSCIITPKNENMFKNFMERIPTFDARVFNIPTVEIFNYFLWRQKDCIRNSILSLGQSVFSHNEMQGLNTQQIKNKLLSEHNIDWIDQPHRFKFGCLNVYHKDYGQSYYYESILDHKLYYERLFDDVIHPYS